MIYLRIKAVSASEPGRTVHLVHQVAESLEDDMHLQELTLFTEEGIIAVIPLELRPGISWPPLPLMDWSAVSQAYFERVIALVDDDEN